VFNAAGFVTGPDGTGTVEVSLEAGPLPHGAADPFFDFTSADRLLRNNGLRAEIRLVLRNHGPILPGRVSEQTSQFMGGCDVFACFDPQAAIFPPVH
jgi:hypothetical protein